MGHQRGNTGDEGMECGLWGSKCRVQPAQLWGILSLRHCRNCSGHETGSLSGCQSQGGLSRAELPQSGRALQGWAHSLSCLSLLAFAALREQKLQLVSLPVPPAPIHRRVPPAAAGMGTQSQARFLLPHLPQGSGGKL